MNDGFSWMFANQLVTVWSAPNYCGRSGNVAAILSITEGHEKRFKVFEAVEASSKVPATRVTPNYFL